MSESDKLHFARRHLCQALGVGAAALVVRTKTAAAFATKPDPLHECKTAFGIKYGCENDGDNDYDDSGVGPADVYPDSPSCFLKGTLIATAICERQVEDIMPGDLILTHPDGLKQVRHVRHVMFTPVPFNAVPIRIRKYALGAAGPVADLYLSQQHAVLVNGALVTARSLVNGDTISHVGNLDRVEYFHIEMDEHELIYAHGIPSETFMERDAEFSMPVLDLSGGWKKMASHLRSAVSPWFDRRLPVDRIRDSIAIMGNKYER